MSTNTDFSHYKENYHDEYLNVTVKSVLLKSSEHVVFLDENSNVQWKCSTEKHLRACYPDIANRVASLEARSEFLRQAHSARFKISGTDNDSTNTDNDLTNVRSLIAQAIIQALISESDKYGSDKPGHADTEGHANKVLDTAEAWIVQRSSEVSRLWFFRPFSFFFGASFITLLLLLAFYPKHGNRALPFTCMAAGGVGAFISSAIGCATRIPEAASAGRRLHTLEAAIRWSVGLGAGVLVYLITRSDLLAIFPTVAPDSTHAVVAAALLAGASERFFPSLIKKLDDPELKKK